MHFSTALTTLSAFAVMSTSVHAFQADFDTWDVPNCNGLGFPPHYYNYPTVNKDVCGDLPNARSLKIGYLEGNCRCKSAALSNSRLAIVTLTMDV